jgi:hypothetical protein
MQASTACKEAHQGRQARQAREAGKESKQGRQARQATGNRQQATGNRQQTAGSRQQAKQALRTATVLHGACAQSRQQAESISITFITLPTAL